MPSRTLSRLVRDWRPPNLRGHPVYSTTDTSLHVHLNNFKRLTKFEFLPYHCRFRASMKSLRVNKILMPLSPFLVQYSSFSFPHYDFPSPSQLTSPSTTTIAVCITHTPVILRSGNSGMKNMHPCIISTILNIFPVDGLLSVDAEIVPPYCRVGVEETVHHPLVPRLTS